MRNHWKNRLLLAALACAVCLTASPVALAQQTEVPKAAGGAAMGALDHSLNVVRRTKNYELMGLRSKAEIDDAVLGTPLPVREIGYDLLIALEEGADPGKVFTGPEQLVYPVMVGGEVRSAVTLVRTNETWQVTGYGESARAMAIQDTKMGLGKELGMAGTDDGGYSLVSVPAFRLTFVATTRDGKTLLKPLTQNLPPELALEGATEESEVISKLSEYARAYDEKYGEGIRARRLVQ